MDKEIILTAEGRKDLETELAEREGAKAEEIRQALQEARSFGDLSENAEYDAAKDEQARNEARINEIRQILAVAKDADAIETSGVLSVSIGSTVELEDASGKRSSFTIVGTTETDSLHHRISSESPAGSVLIGHVVGDSVSFTTPTGKVREYTIANITR